MTVTKASTPNAKPTGTIISYFAEWRERERERYLELQVVIAKVGNILPMLACDTNADLFYLIMNPLGPLPKEDGMAWGFSGAAGNDGKKVKQQKEPKRIMSKDDLAEYLGQSKEFPPYVAVFGMN